ncbi:MAG: MiaB/RimO family radical SAM methylthiotransferase [Candidatus Gracilibacteria bacterium]|nr:MiaB/RimO family radical SAM methylthiotransferase [Candidatus Gracilibacteria bacterium]
MKKYFIWTFGCQMNYADSEKLAMILRKSGFEKADSWQESDLVIFNTCSVRQKGEDRVFGFIREIKKYNKELDKTGEDRVIKIGITGCMVRKTGISSKYIEMQRKRITAKKIDLIRKEKGIYNYDDKLFPRSKELDFVIRIEDIRFLTKILSEIYDEQIGDDANFDDYLKAQQLRENPASANIVIQTGCDNFCTYCIVPYTRGREKSRNPDDIILEIKDAVKNGAKEVTLLGQNVNSYGKQFKDKYWDKETFKWHKNAGKSPFRELLEEINKIEGLNRIRFTSSNPHDMTDDILSSHFELDKNCNYLHFAMQSGNDEMLKKMNRRHTYEDFKRIVKYLRSKDELFGISTDIIVGFSGETEKNFQDTVMAMKELEFDFAYLARYSVRKGTLASKMYPDDVPQEVKAERWHILNNILEENVKKRNSLMLNREEDVLISREDKDNFYGRTRNFKEVRIVKNSDIKIGDLVKVKILKIEGWMLFGEVV